MPDDDLADWYADGDGYPDGVPKEEQVAPDQVKEQVAPVESSSCTGGSSPASGVCKEQLAPVPEREQVAPEAQSPRDPRVDDGSDGCILQKHQVGPEPASPGQQVQKDQAGPAVDDGVECLVFGVKTMRRDLEIQSAGEDGQQAQKDLGFPDLAAPAVADESHGCIVQMDQVGPELATPTALDGRDGRQAQMDQVGPELAAPAVDDGGCIGQKDQVGPEPATPGQQVQKDQVGPAVDDGVECSVFGVKSMRRDLVIQSAGEDGQQAQKHLGGPELAAPAVADGDHGCSGLKDLVGPERPAPCAVVGGDGIHAQMVNVPEVLTAEKTRAGEGPFELLSGVWLQSFVAHATSIEQVVRDLSRDLGVEYDLNEDCHEAWQRYQKVISAYHSLAGELSCLSAKTDRADVSTTRLALVHAQSCIVEARQARLPPPPPACNAGSGIAGKNKSKRRGRG